MSHGPTKPIPRPAPESRPFWNAAAQHRLELPLLFRLSRILVSALSQLPPLPLDQLRVEACFRPWQGF